MKILKNILSVIIVIGIVMNANLARAETVNLLEGVTMTNTDGYAETPENITDGDLSTGSRFAGGGQGWQIFASYKFSEPKDIAGFTTMSNGAFGIRLYNSSGTYKQFTNYDNVGDVFKDAIATDIVEVRIYSTVKKTYTTIYDFQLFELDDNLRPGDLTVLNTELTDTTIDFYLDAPDDMAYVKVYRNDVLVQSNLTSEYFKDTGLKQQTEYTYKFVTYNSSGIPSKNGTEIKLKTIEGPDLTPPLKPLDPTVRSADQSLKVIFPQKTGLTRGYYLYLDGVKYSDTYYQSPSVLLKGLTNGQEYSIEIEPISKNDILGEKSNIVKATPEFQDIPEVSVETDLDDIGTGVSSWFGSIWYILAFAVSIPVAFAIGFEFKRLFLH